MATPSSSSSIAEWAPSDLAACTFRTRLIALPEAFVRYLKTSGPMVLPRTKRSAAALSWSESDTTREPEFPELEAEIEAGIGRLGGEAFVRLDFNSPRDAAWLNGGLKCRDAADVFGLLKASARLELAPRPTLALREWWDLEPSLEFRAFAKKGRLVGVCQRKTDSVFRYDDLNAFRHRIAAFFDARLRTYGGDLVFDLYLAPNKRDWLVGLKRYGEPTAPLLFDWPHLDGLSSDDEAGEEGPAAPTDPASFELRVLGADGDNPPVVAAEMASSRAPSDVIDLAAAGGLDSFIAQVRQQAALFPDDVSSSDEDGGSSSGDDDDDDDLSRVPQQVAQQ